jgi:membrane-associated protease RseP (regulator of RpoE activity)
VKDPLERYPLEVRQIARGLAGLVVVFIALAVTNPNLAGTVGVLFFFFVVMIGLHELGHFVMAKRAGMKVTEFFIGFGPRLWSFRRGDTEYGVKALPLGGYCKIIGMTNLEDIDPADEPRTYRAKGWWARVSTVAAGPVTHFALALLFAYAILVGSGDVRRGEISLQIDEVVAAIPGVNADGTALDEQDMVATPASGSDLRVGDLIVERDGERVTDWVALTDYFRAHAGEQVELTVMRAERRVTVDLEIMRAYGNDTSGVVTHEPFKGAVQRGFVGLGPKFEVPSVGVVEGVWRAPLRTWQAGVDTAGALAHIFSPAGISDYLSNFSDDRRDEQASETRFVSPVGFGNVASDAVRAGWVTVFALLLSINLFVGILNLVPVLPFDGGHIAVATYEAIASKIRGRQVRADFNRLLPVMVATLSVLAFIFLSSLVLDIANPIDTNF